MHNIKKWFGIFYVIMTNTVVLASTTDEQHKMKISDEKKEAPRLLYLVDYHDPILRQVAQTVHFPLSEQDKQLIADMKYSIQAEQLKKANAPFHAAAGMAANQWGINKRIFLFSPIDGTKVEVIINPKYTAIQSQNSENNQENEALDWEGCFSIPLATGQIRRYVHIKAEYQNEAGEHCEKELKGRVARVWQHETDHLDGFLYDDHRHKKCVHKEVFLDINALASFYKAKRAASTQNNRQEDNE